VPYLLVDQVGNCAKACMNCGLAGAQVDVLLAAAKRKSEVRLGCTVPHIDSFGVGHNSAAPIVLPLSPTALQLQPLNIRYKHWVV